MCCCVIENEQQFTAYEDGSTGNESTSGFWGVLARKAKAMLDDDHHHVVSQQHDTSQSSNNNTSTQPQVNKVIIYIYRYIFSFMKHILCIVFICAAFLSDFFFFLSTSFSAAFISK